LIEDLSNKKMRIYSHMKKWLSCNQKNMEKMIVPSTVSKKYGIALESPKIVPS
jgi:hypothetical protein